MLVKNRLPWGKVIKCICCSWLILKKMSRIIYKRSFLEPDGWSWHQMMYSRCPQPNTRYCRNRVRNNSPTPSHVSEGFLRNVVLDCMIGIWSYFQCLAKRVFKPRNQQWQKWVTINVGRSFVGWLTFKITKMLGDNGKKHGRKPETHWGKVFQPEVSSFSIRWRLFQSPREWKQENPGVKCFLNVPQRSVMLVIRNTALWACSESTHRCWTTEAFCEKKFSPGVMENLKGCLKKEVWKW